MQDHETTGESRSVPQAGAESLRRRRALISVWVPHKGFLTIRRARVVTALAGTWNLAQLGPSKTHPFRLTKSLRAVSNMARYSRPLTASGDCHLEIVNSYKWIADPRFGSFKVYVDGKAVGNAPLASSLKVAVLPGRRTVRVRLWWYLTEIRQ